MTGRTKRWMWTAAVAATMMLIGTCSAFAADEGSDGTYNDVPANHWAAETIQKLSQNGVIKGYPDGTFRPEAPVSSGEWIKLAVEASAIMDRKESPVADAAEPQANRHWAAAYYDAGLTAGWYTKDDIQLSGLDYSAKRGEMALIVSGVIGKALPANHVEIGKGLRDVYSTTSYEYEIICACGAGILTGYPDGTFKPKASLTRAEAATVIWRLLHEDARVPFTAKTPSKEDTYIALNIPQAATDEMIASNPDLAWTKSYGFADESAKVEGDFVLVQKVLESVKFTGSAGNYSMEVNFPILPEGYKWNFYSSIDWKNFGGWAAISGWTLVDEYKIVPKGKVVKKITGLNNLQDITQMGVVIDLISEDEGTCGYGMTYYPETKETHASIDGFGNVQRPMVYDFKTHLLWK